MRVPIESPTKRLIQMQQARLEKKTAIARQTSPQRNLDRVLVYSTQPKVAFETSVNRLQVIADQAQHKVKKVHLDSDERHDLAEAQEQLEKEVAVELVPALRDRLQTAYTPLPRPHSQDNYQAEQAAAKPEAAIAIATAVSPKKRVAKIRIDDDAPT
jgi:hypothetical protein